MIPEVVIFYIFDGILFVLSLLNVYMNIRLLRNIAQITLEKRVIQNSHDQYSHDQIHSLLNNRLLDIQNKRYTAQINFKGKNVI